MTDEDENSLEIIVVITLYSWKQKDEPKKIELINSQSSSSALIHSVENFVSPVITGYFFFIYYIMFLIYIFWLYCNS